MARATAPLFARIFLGMLAGTLIAGAAVSAQPVPSDRDRQPRTETEGQAPSSPEDPGNRLDRQKGILRPPQAVDPGMQIAPPDPASRMPVIPPPGSPGGDQGIEPK